MDRQVRATIRLVMQMQMLFRYQGHTDTYLIIAAHGSTSKFPYCTMGSGTLVAMFMLESR